MTVLVANGNGLGDAIVLSAVAHELRGQRPGERLVVLCQYPEFYVNNPDVDDAMVGSGVETRSFPALDDMAATGGRHQVAWMCEQLGLKPPLEVRQRFDFGINERSWSWMKWSSLVAIDVQPGPWAWQTKAWTGGRWRSLVSALTEWLDLTVVQIGGGEAVPSAMDCRNLPLRQSADILAACGLHVGPISGPMHLANAVGTMSVVIAGGREVEAVVGYPADVWMTDAPAEGCSPCWGNTCAYPKVDGTASCLAAISVDAVVDVVRASLGRVDK